ncbi:NucA/NucB deoxyribonuclease domain-containing protein [Nonomuraea salmonea]|uniref:NucA/NucB deoxyribonuclease domain-containing protein n=1 Tax=Nonomuraea salmonea TaxID=46181 RepID=UPI003CD06A8D
MRSFFADRPRKKRMAPPEDEWQQCDEYPFASTKEGGAYDHPPVRKGQFLRTGCPGNAQLDCRWRSRSVLCQVPGPARQQVLGSGSMTYFGDVVGAASPKCRLPAGENE